MRKLALLPLLFCAALCGAVKLSHDDSEVRVVPEENSPQPKTVVVRIVFPKEQKNYNKLPIHSQIRLEGFSLGTITPFERGKMLREDPKGQTVRVIIDNNPYVSYDQSVEDSFDENREYYDKILSFELPGNISPGEHIIRAFPARSFGESLKLEGSFNASTFYYRDSSKRNTLNVDLTKPYLTYNEPQGEFSGDKPILLDFYISNCQLSKDGYRVRFSIDGKVVRLLTAWAPYFIYGLPKGNHTVRLELIDKDGKRVSGIFNDVKRTITVN